MNGDRGNIHLRAPPNFVVRREIEIMLTCQCQCEVDDDNFICDGFIKAVIPGNHIQVVGDGRCGTSIEPLIAVKPDCMISRVRWMDHKIRKEQLQDTLTRPHRLTQHGRTIVVLDNRVCTEQTCEILLTPPNVTESTRPCTCQWLLCLHCTQ